MPKHTAIEATWEPTTQTWIQTNHRCGQPVPFSATWPTSGMTRSGKLSPLPPSERHTGENEYSSSPVLPTPIAGDALGARNATSSRQPGSKHHSGTTLTDVFWQMAGKTDARHLLPTPSVALGTGGQTSRSGSRKGEPLLGNIGDLLPTPNASDCTGGGAHPDNREGHSRQLIDYALLHGSSRWGRYAPVIERWEGLTRPAPVPTEPNKNGNPRLHAPFVEWMMGFTPGWICDLTSSMPRTKPAMLGMISRNDTLRCLGNAVVPQQAYAPLRDLLEVEG